jgi:hypothetical protein
MSNHRHHLRDRAQTTPTTARAAYPGSGILPTPDPTVASCISDEDVARTLIALGDASNYSHGRTSNSTMDETFSGAADAASSTGATSDSDEYSDEDSGMPKNHAYASEQGAEEEVHEGHIKSEYDDYENIPKTKKIKTKMHDGPSTFHRPGRAGSHTKSKSGKARPSGMKPPKISTSGSMPAPRKVSSTSSTGLPPFGADEEDLSSKPRCQRCRKSKKGCDRQRPCQRCKDAGIGIEGCVSEDEGNGRRGRFGRHMGVPVKRTADDMDGAGEETLMLPPMAVDAAEGMDLAHKDKKRKR